jgi:primosomal protein N' (replication factor Y)
MYAQVAVNVPHVKGLYDYQLPASLGEVAPGCLVVVPFGAQTVQGVVLRLVEEASVPETRPVQALLDPQPVLTPAQLGLAGWLSEETLAPLATCLELMLPPGLSQQADTLYHLAEPPAALAAAPLSPTQRRILDRLRQRGDLRGRQLEAAFPHVEWRTSALALERRGWLTRRPVLPPPSARPKSVRTVQLAVPPAEAEARLPALGRGNALARRQAILQFLMKEPWPVDVAWAYAASGGNLQDLYSLAEDGLVLLGESETWRDPLEKVEIVLQQPPVLTPDQQAAWSLVQAGLLAATGGQPGKPFLLHGVTGSGKTEIYLLAVAEALRLGRSAIVLVPEISLTPQTVRRFLARFPGQVGLLHSRLSEGERYDTWRRARAGLLKVIVGPRSALFAPLPDLGLVVVDEFHDESYYQDEMEPRYHAVRAAAAYARLANCTLLLGSATPEVTWLYQARREGWPILELPLRILAHRQVEEDFKRRDSIELQSLPLPPVRVVDMRQELKAGNRSIFSRALLEAMQHTLQAGQQAILFLNRRGKATYVFCRECGYSLRCPRCDLPLTMHTTQETGATLICHACGYRRQVPKTCPQCGSRAIRQFGTGTEKVESEVQQALPGVRTLRYDFETTRQRGAHDVLLAHFANHHADVLVGTQMLTKGLDLPLVTLVGVVLADTGLNLDDYRAPERTFQTLVQVAGRAGRSALGGQVVLQTFMPEHYAIQAAAGHDFAGFYEQELAYRRKLGYPPFARLVRLELRQPDAGEAEQEARRMARQLQQWIDEGGFSATSLIGPVPCFYSRLAGNYRWQVVLRGPNPLEVLRGRSLAGWRVEVDPMSLL